MKAIDMPTMPIDLFACARCGHVQNTSFYAETIPHDLGLKMYNQGHQWSAHLDTQIETLVTMIGPDATVLEVGCGDGRFLKRIGSHIPKGRMIGIDPAASFSSSGLELISRRLRPDDIRQIGPDLIIIRHVLEHLEHPRLMLEQIASECLKPTLIYAEVPCFDPALSEGRCADLLYEHCSHFREQSFRALWSCISTELITQNSPLNGEVLCCLRRVLPDSRTDSFVDLYCEKTKTQPTRLMNTLQSLVDTGNPVVVWGGTGKAAALLNRSGFKGPLLVVDSHEQKVGGWVPGLGLPITSPKNIKGQPIIVVPSKWRLDDIIADIAAYNITPQSIWVEQGGSLCQVDG